MKYYIVCGRSWCNELHYHHATVRSNSELSYKGNSVGFRLIKKRKL